MGVRGIKPEATNNLGIQDLGEVPASPLKKNGGETVPEREEELEPGWSTDRGPEPYTPDLDRKSIHRKD